MSRDLLRLTRSAPAYFCDAKSVQYIQATQRLELAYCLAGRHLHVARRPDGRPRPHVWIVGAAPRVTGSAMFSAAPPRSAAIALSMILRWPTRTPSFSRSASLSSARAIPRRRWHCRGTSRRTAPARFRAASRRSPRPSRSCVARSPSLRRGSPCRSCL